MLLLYRLGWCVGGIQNPGQRKPGQEKHWGCKASSARQSQTQKQRKKGMASSAEIDRLTRTQREQLEVEKKVQEIFQLLADISPRSHSALLELWRDQHIDFLMQGIEFLGSSYSVLDANRPWICYWILNSVALLGKPIERELRERAINFLCRCQDPDGGYAGGPGQMPHLATTYAAVNTLVTIGGERALASINRDRMLQFLLRMKDPSGGFRMHDGGEMDVRGCYTAIAVATILRILNPALVHNLANYIVRCQTYEGGIAGEPGAEAHGGYTFCGLAALILINEVHQLHLPSLLDWAVFRQGKVEGGFQGRTNKLVDGCYSFWQGGLFPLLQKISELVQQQLSMSYAKTGEQDENSNSDNRVQYQIPKKSYITSFTGSEEVGVGEERIAQQLHASTAGSMLDNESENLATAEKIFPAIDLFRRTSVLIEDVEDDEDSKSSSSSENMECSNDPGLRFLENEIQCGPLFNTHALQGYILLCCQMLDGGLRDKPGKSRDYYHTCYGLSGLSTAQYSWSHQIGAPPIPGAVLGPFCNLLEPVHPVLNVVLGQYYNAHRYFSSI